MRDTLETLPSKMPLPQLRGSLGDVAQVTNAAYLCITAVLDKNPGPWILSVRVLLNFTKLISSGRCVFFLCLIFFIIYTTTDGKPMHFWASGDLPMTKAYWLSTTYGKNSVLVSGFLQWEKRDKVLSLVTPIKCSRKSKSGSYRNWKESKINVGSRKD